MITQDRTLLALSQTRIKLDDVQGLEATSVSTMVISTSGVPLVVERTMRWDATGYGAHAEKASAGTAPEWYFAEGSQGFFSTFLLLSNPHAAPNTAHVTWLREGQTPVQRDYPMGPSSRHTVNAGDESELVNTSFGARVVFDLPGVAERAMYFGTNPFWRGGHSSAGIPEASPTWFLAEGATGSYFTTYVLLANPNAQPTDVTVRYLPDNGAAGDEGLPAWRGAAPDAEHRGRRCHARERGGRDGSHRDTSDRRRTRTVLAGHRMGRSARERRRHLDAHTLGSGRRPGRRRRRITRPTSCWRIRARTTRRCVVTFLRPTGETIIRFFDVPAASRRNVSIAGPTSDVPELINASFGAIIQSTQPIAVERSMYSDAGGMTWAAGTNVTATRLP